MHTTKAHTLAIVEYDGEKVHLGKDQLRVLCVVRALWKAWKAL